MENVGEWIKANTLPSDMIVIQKELYDEKIVSTVLFYKPIAMFRFKKGYYQFLVEDKAYSFLKSII